MKQFISHRSKIVPVLAALVLTVGFGATVAWAANLQFNNASATINTDGDLVCSFKITGLGDNGTADVTCNADATATYGCINKGGKNPSAANKQNEAGPVRGEGLFSSGKNGNVTGSLTAEPPPTTLSCPNGQVLRLCFVSYTNIDLSAAGVAGSAAGQSDTADVQGTLSLNTHVASNCP